MKRTNLKSEISGEPGAYKNNADHVRINVYGSSTSTSDEIDTAFTDLRSFLDDISGGSSDPLGGYELHSYETDVFIYQSEQDGAKNLLDQGYDALKGDFDDEHALVLWVYSLHDVDASNCGTRGPEDCPDTFMQGSDINNNSLYDADKRQPYIHFPESEMSLYDIQQGFTYINSQELPLSEFGFASTHELAHALVEHSVYKDENLVPDQPQRSQHPDHYLGTRQYDSNLGYYYATVCATGSNPEAMENGECSDITGSEYERTVGSSCFKTAAGLTRDYFKNNV